jgi:hypothetical protein
MIIIVLNILFLGAIVWIGRQMVAAAPLGRFYYLAVGVKLAAGVAVGLVYHFYFPGGDTWTHFQNARYLSEASFTSWHDFFDVFVFNNYDRIDYFLYSGEPRSAFFCKIIALLNVLTGANYWVTGMYLSMFSFAGLWYLADRLYQYSDNNLLAAVSIIFFPSLVFWSAGVMKESIAIGAMAFVFAIVLDQVQSKNFRWQQLTLITLLIYLTYLLKYYYAALLVAVVMALFVVILVKQRRSTWLTDLLMWLTVLSASVVIVTWLHPNLSLSSVLVVIVGNHNAYVDVTNEQNLVNYFNLVPTWQAVVLNSPRAWFSGIFSPLTVGGGNIFKFWVVLENWWLLILTITSLLSFRMPGSRDQRLLLLAAISYISLMAIFLALSTPNLGTLARYKVGFMPIFLYLISVNQYKVTAKIRQWF